MAKEHLATYLNDHLAGATAALELLEHLESAYAGTAVAHLAAGLRGDITADRQELEAIIRRTGGSRSGLRKAAGWLAERVARFKLWVDDPGGGNLRLLESLEVLALGIEGKRALWASLAAAAPEVPELRGPDYERLARRAEEQRGRVEPVRLDAARAAFAARPAPAAR